VEREHAAVELHVQVLPAAEGAPDAGERDADAVLGEVQHGGDLLPVDVQPLCRDDQIDAPVLGGDRESRLGAERRLILHRGLVVALDPHLGLGRGIALLDPHVTEHVAPLA
jgi:hypothetical protein